MKKIIACIALSLLSLVFTIGAFVTNDLTAYKDWAVQNYPQFERKLEKHMPGFLPPRDSELPPPPGKPERGDGHHKKSHEKAASDTPSGDAAKNAPAPEEKK